MRLVVGGFGLGKRGLGIFGLLLGGGKLWGKRGKLRDALAA